MTEEQARKRIKSFSRYVADGMVGMRKLQRQIKMLYFQQFVMIMLSAFFVMMSWYDVQNLYSMMAYVSICFLFTFISMVYYPYMHKRIRKEYLKYFFRSRSYLDKIVTIIDWTVFRHVRLRHRYRESVVKLIDEFNDVAQNRWSPLKSDSGIQLSLRFVISVNVVVIFVLQLAICYQKYTAIPWHYHF